MTSGLSFSATSEFKEAVAKLGGVVWYGLPGATDLWQPIDAVYAQILKVLIGQAQRPRGSTTRKMQRSGTAMNHPSQPRKGGF